MCYNIEKLRNTTKVEEDKDMRIEVLARKENETTTIYRKFDNELDAMMFDWEMRMQGYTTRIIK